MAKRLHILGLDIEYLFGFLFTVCRSSLGPIEMTSFTIFKAPKKVLFVRWHNHNFVRLECLE